MTHEVIRLWVRPAKGATPEDRDRLDLEAGRGVVGDHKLGGKRHLTVIFEDDWADATRDVGVAVDPAERRANVLVTGGDGQRLVGRTIRIGETELEVRGITLPCERMDRAEPGLRKAMEPDGRGGVWGVVTAGGTIGIGDMLVPA